MIIEANCTTGEVIERELTADELAQAEADKANAIALKNAAAAAEAQALAAKETAQAKLSALGLTTDDLKALGL
jgi:hypothetical protein